MKQWSEHQIEILFDGYSPQQGNTGLDTIIFAIHGVGIGCRFEPIAGQQVRELVKNRSEYLTCIKRIESLNCECLDRNTVEEAIDNE